MEDLNIEAFKKAWLSYEDIESVKRWIKDVQQGRIYSEEEFYSQLEKRLFSQEKTYV